MSKDYTGTLGEVAPDSANPEVAVNDIVNKTEAALTEISADTLPEGGTAGQVLGLNPSGKPAWLDPTAGGSDDLPAGAAAGKFLTADGSGKLIWAGVPAELPSGGSAGQILYRTASGVAWGDPPAGGSGGSGSGSKPFFAGGTFQFLNSDGGTQFSDLKGCSVTRKSAGIYYITFDTPADDDNYGVLISAKWPGGVNNSHSFPDVGVDRDNSNNLSKNGFGIVVGSGQYDGRVSFACFKSATALIG